MSPPSYNSGGASESQLTDLLRVRSCPRGRRCQTTAQLVSVDGVEISADAPPPPGIQAAKANSPPRFGIPFGSRQHASWRGRNHRRGSRADLGSTISRDHRAQHPARRGHSRRAAHKAKVICARTAAISTAPIYVGDTIVNWRVLCVASGLHRRLAGSTVKNPRRSSSAPRTSQASRPQFRDATSSKAGGADHRRRIDRARAVIDLLQNGPPSTRCIAAEARHRHERRAAADAG